MTSTSTTTEFCVLRLIVSLDGPDDEPSRININAVNAADAARAADEIKYAAEWERGVYSDKNHKAPPADWAVNAAHINDLC